MKKYYSLIAVSMFAVASVFTSCDKNDAGSSYNPEVAVSQSTSNSKAASVDRDVKISGPLTDIRQMTSELQSMLQSKVGSIAQVTFSQSRINFDTEDYDGLATALSKVTNDDYENIVSKYPQCTVSIVFKINGKSLINYTHAVETVTGTWKATLDGKECSVSVSSTKKDDGVEATAVYDGNTYTGKVKESNYTVIFTSDQMYDNTTHHVRIVLGSTAGLANATSFSGRIYVDGTTVANDVDFAK